MLKSRKQKAQKK